MRLWAVSWLFGLFGPKVDRIPTSHAIGSGQNLWLFLLRFFGFFVAVFLIAFSHDRTFSGGLTSPPPDCKEFRKIRVA